MLRSRDSNIRSFVKFKNCSCRVVEVHWINFHGNNIHYSNLKCGETIVVNTFTTHPWIFICQKTGERLRVNNNEVFLAKPWFNFIANSDNGLVSVEREEAQIHIALKSLKDICLWKIIYLIRQKDDIDYLQIPKTLKNDLAYFFYLSTRYREIESENSTSE
ncbi:hypothetical protein PVAND_008053 [Polypedilum vanderplanki]|uniref:von Hippel-Lindau disease tumour suppressor beta domain-containing protein n=1 Tax=Polypedilum vanderplanki TaxID=319348 RepID=A0A9J6C9C0_POLVA|nr:hypothetical protein PVAND_008053 [Polypedilum vanderplanki]